MLCTISCPPRGPKVCLRNSSHNLGSFLDDAIFLRFLIEGLPVKSSVVRFCRVCRTSKPADEFDETSRCRQCVKKDLKTYHVRVSVPDGWTSSAPGLPEMLYPARDETASKDPWKIKIRWMGNHAKYFCRVIRGDNDEEPQEVVTHDYPHDVVSWLASWFARIEEEPVVEEGDSA